MKIPWYMIDHQIKNLIYLGTMFLDLYTNSMLSTAGINRGKHIKVYIIRSVDVNLPIPTLFDNTEA